MRTNSDDAGTLGPSYLGPHARVSCACKSSPIFARIHEVFANRRTQRQLAVWSATVRRAATLASREMRALGQGCQGLTRPAPWRNGLAHCTTWDKETENNDVSAFVDEACIAKEMAFAALVRKHWSRSCEGWFAAVYPSRARATFCKLASAAAAGITAPTKAVIAVATAYSWTRHDSMCQSHACLCLALACCACYMHSVLCRTIESPSRAAVRATCTRSFAAP